MHADANGHNDAQSPRLSDADRTSEKPIITILPQLTLSITSIYKADQRPLIVIHRATFNYTNITEPNPT